MSYSNASDVLQDQSVVPTVPSGGETLNRFVCLSISEKSVTSLFRGDNEARSIEISKIIATWRRRRSPESTYCAPLEIKSTQSCSST
jgi:hypothetical protein